MYRFPEGFLWGAATSAYQIEGSPLADGAGVSIQHRFAHTPGNTADGATGDIAADHYRRFADDIAIMRDLGLPAYQFSTAWSRIIPDGTGTVNTKGLDFYDRLVDLLLEAGVGPVPILHVWDLPGALQDRGGWANRDSASWFAEFAAVVFERIGDRATHWLTICEPNAIAYFGYGAGVIPPGVRDLYAGLRAAHHLLLGHARAVQAFRASGARGQIGTSTAATVAKPASAAPADVAAAERATNFMNAVFLDPIMIGEYPEEVARFGDAWPEVADEDLETIAEPIDFVGVTYFSRSTVGARRGESTEARSRRELLGQAGQIMEELMDVQVVMSDDDGSPADADGLLDVLRWVRDRYRGPPIVITENGTACPDTVAADGTIDDRDRIAFIRDHLVAAHHAIEEGVDLRGWFVWSLLDTYEFYLGYRARFGLVHVDHATQQRTVKRSGRWYADVIANNGFEVDQ